MVQRKVTQRQLVCLMNKISHSYFALIKVIKEKSICAVKEKLGTAQNIQKTFIDFQQYLYQEIRV